MSSSSSSAAVVIIITDPSVNISDCELAYQVIANSYAQFGRLVLLILLLVQFLLVLPLFVEYRRRKTVLHGNLKFLYLNLVIAYLFGTLGHSLIEFRHLLLGIFYVQWPCAMLTPFWYLLLSKWPTLFYVYSIPIFHFAIMLERFRATKYANNYEYEGVRFGIYSVLIIYLVVSLMIGTILFLVFADDAGYNFFKMLPVNTVTNKVSNILYQVYTGFFILLVILTAIGDIWLYRKNKELMASRNAATKDQAPLAPPEYNLSQKYQLRENYTAMRFILPLDITYMLFIFISNILVIVLRSWEMPMAAFLAHYNFVNSLMVIYAIISLLLYWRFLHAHEFWRNLQNPKGKIVPLEELGQAYFEQLKHQWN